MTSVVSGQCLKNPIWLLWCQACQAPPSSSSGEPVEGEGAQGEGPRHQLHRGQLSFGGQSGILLTEITNECFFKVVVCGYTRDAIARVFSFPDGDLVHLLKCVPEGTRLGFCGGQVPDLDISTSSSLIVFRFKISLWPHNDQFWGTGPTGHQQQVDCHSGRPGWFRSIKLSLKLSYIFEIVIYFFQIVTQIGIHTQIVIHIFQIFTQIVIHLWNWHSNYCQQLDSDQWTCSLI